jgi:hypothetical protein
MPWRKSKYKVSNMKQIQMVSLTDGGRYELEMVLLFNSSGVDDYFDGRQLVLLQRLNKEEGR